FNMFRIFVCFFVFCSFFSPVQAADSNTEDKTPIEKNCLVLLVDFPDAKHHPEREQVEKRFNIQLNKYFDEMSYGKMKVNFTVTNDWHTLPNPVSHYRIAPQNLKVDKNKIRALIQDSIDSVDSYVDFSKYDFVVLYLAAELKEYGMIGLCGYPGMLGWKEEVVLKTKSGQVINGGIAIFLYRAHLGTLFHDIAHVLGGVKNGKRVVPCLYDHDLQAKPGDQRAVFENSIINMGFWDPMSCHFYKYRVPPPGISSWTKLRLGWIDENKIKEVSPGETVEVVLGPLEDGSSDTLVIKIPLTETTYYLIENRQKTGTFDKDLYGDGVLIMYADDTIPECRNGKAPVKLIDADPSMPKLGGASFDVGKEGKKDVYLDETNNIKIEIKEKLDNGSYRILIGTAN
ncbi:MAG: hypothetical protein KKH83_08570, partial [Candidatus Margulisbacteria bacterium]|nr:hypothetical protein [Candidatus Margulisiibacteriota bacterium]